MELRAAAAGDLPAIQAIYAHHVLRGLASFEEVPPDVAEMRRRHAEVVARGLPYLVAVERGEILGYGYCAPYRSRSAYRYALEDSIYIKDGHLGKGIGTRLLTELLRVCEGLGYRQMTVLFRMQAFWKQLRGVESWGKMTREGFGAKPPSTLKP